MVYIKCTCTCKVKQRNNYTALNQRTSGSDFRYQSQIPRSTRPSDKRTYSSQGTYVAVKCGTGISVTKLACLAKFDRKASDSTVRRDGGNVQSSLKVNFSRGGRRSC